MPDKTMGEDKGHGGQETTPAGSCGKGLTAKKNKTRLTGEPDTTAMISPIYRRNSISRTSRGPFVDVDVIVEVGVIFQPEGKTGSRAGC